MPEWGPILWPLPFYSDGNWYCSGLSHRDLDRWDGISTAGQLGWNRDTRWHSGQGLTRTMWRAMTLARLRGISISRDAGTRGINSRELTTGWGRMAGMLKWGLECKDIPVPRAVPRHGGRANMGFQVLCVSDLGFLCPVGCHTRAPCRGECGFCGVEQAWEGSTPCHP